MSPPAAVGRNEVLMDTQTLVRSDTLIAGAQVWAIDADTPPRCVAMTGRESIPAHLAVPDAVAACVESWKPVIEADRVAYPVVDRQRITSVVLMELAIESQTTAGVEVWTSRPGRSELGLGASRYAGLEHFGRLSRHVCFPRGSGVPGLAWDTGLPRLVEHVAESSDFMRRSGAESAGLDMALGIPISKGHQLLAVLLLLSSRDRPLARATELWLPGKRGDSLRLACSSGVYRDAEHVARASRRLDRPAGDGWIGRAWATRCPQIVSDPSAAALQRDGAAEDGLSTALAIPILLLDDVRAVLGLMW